MGGGFLVNLNATELNTIITSGCSDCKINTPYSDITNNSTFSTASSSGIEIQARIGTFTNYGDIKVTSNSNQSIAIQRNGYVGHFTNYGTMERMFWINQDSIGVETLTNYGTMGGIKNDNTKSAITLNNYGIMGFVYGQPNQGRPKTNNLEGNVRIQTYTLQINQSATQFNSSTTGSSHLVIDSAATVRFKDSKSKIMLDFGGNFELGKEYDISKVATNTNSGTYSALGVNFSRLSTYNDIYTLTKVGANGFKAEIAPQYGTMGTLYKSNIRTMNNFLLMSNAMIYPHKYKGTNRSTRKRVIRRVRKTANLFDSLDSFESNKSPISSLRGSGEATTKQSTNANESSPLRHTERSEVSKTRESNSQQNAMIEKGINELDSHLQQNDFYVLESNGLDSSLQATLFAQNDKESISYNDESFALASLSSNDTFFYKSDSLLLTDSQSEQRAKRMRNSTQNLNTRSVNQTNNPNNSNTNRIAQNNNYYFILTPFANHNYFFESGRYNLSGLEYGFVTAFSGKLNNTNSLGTHFIFSYANLNDKDDSVFNIKSMNINLGLNYKLDLIWNMYLKARIDGFYFMNEVKSISIRDKIKPNTLGFGASIYYGKDFNFNNAGILGLSLGLDYKGLYANDFIMSNMADSSIYEKYNKQLYNLLYLDLAVDYNKYFSSSVGLWGLNTKFGIKGNITNNALSKSKVFLSNNRSVDMIVDNDKVLGYANISGSYVLNTKDFDMEFSVAYYGNFGDRVMSNGGGVEWRVYF